MEKTVMECLTGFTDTKYNQDPVAIESSATPLSMQPAYKIEKPIPVLTKF